MFDVIEFLFRHWELSLPLAIVAGLLLWVEMRYAAPQLSPQELVRLINDDQAMIVDIRDAKEYQSGHIASAVNYPATTTGANLESVLRGQSRKVVIVCNRGITAKGVAKSLKNVGIVTSVLQGGMTEWLNNNFPVQKR